MARRHFAAEIITKKILDARYWWPTLFKIPMIFAKAVIAVRKLEDSKQKVWLSWLQ